MIPTLLLAGVIGGRWWLVPLGAIAWTALLLLDGVITLAPQLAGAALLGAINTAVGVLLGIGVRATAKRLYQGAPAPS